MLWLLILLLLLLGCVLPYSCCFWHTSTSMQGYMEWIFCTYRLPQRYSQRVKQSVSGIPILYLVVRGLPNSNPDCTSIIYMIVVLLWGLYYIPYYTIIRRVFFISRNKWVHRQTDWLTDWLRDKDDDTTVLITTGAAWFTGWGQWVLGEGSHAFKGRRWE